MKQYIVYIYLKLNLAFKFTIISVCLLLKTVKKIGFNVCNVFYEEIPCYKKQNCKSFSPIYKGMSETIQKT